MNILKCLAEASNKRILLLVQGEESNSGGQVANSEATEAERRIRPAIQILNNTTLLFENLQIGVNNTIGHYGIPDNTEHAWENGLAHLAETGELTYGIGLVKTGQGGSKAEEWWSGSEYTATFNTRLDAALALLNTPANSPKFAFLFSQGINNRIATDWDAAGWITITVGRISYLRERYGMFPVVMTKFKVEFEDLNVAIEAVCNQLQNCYFITTYDLALQDVYHWSYTSQKIVAARMINKLQEKGYCF